MIDINISKALFFRLDAEELNRLRIELPRDLRLHIPTGNGEGMTVELFESAPFAPDAAIWEHDSLGMRKVNVSRGLHYWGIVAGKVRSRVAFSFYENQVIGLILTNEGNYNFGVISGQTPNDINALYVLYNDRDLRPDAKPKFSCSTDDLEYPIKKQIAEQVMANTTTCKQIKIYFEVTGFSYQIAMGSNMTNTVNYVNALFNQMALFYIFEQITLVMGDVKVWTTIPPYNVPNPYGEFITNQIPYNPFTWDLGYLVHISGQRGGTLGSLCRSDRRNRSTFLGAFATLVTPYPTYSFNVYEGCHELGHNLGSPHTQSCSWPGGAIDGCVEVEGSCTRPPAANPGTVMSYCPPNVDLTLGMGPLPGNRVRSIYQNAACLESFTVTADIVSPIQEPVVFCSDAGSIALSANLCIGCTYQWYRNGLAILAANDPNYDVTQGGQYSVAVRKNSCVSFSPVKNVVVHTAPCLANGVITNNQPSEACESAPAGRLTLSGYTGTISSWQISHDNFVTHSVIPITTNTYDYPALSRTTCFRAVINGTFSETECISVFEKPSVTAQTSWEYKIGCRNQLGIITLEAVCPTCSSYRWSPAERLVDATVALPNLRDPQSGTYTVTATDYNGCTNSASVSITIAYKDDDIVLKLLTPNVCEGERPTYTYEGNIEGTGSWQYQTNCAGQWNPTGESGRIFTPTFAVNAGKTCFRYYVIGDQYCLPTDTLIVCGTVRFTCTQTNYSETFNNWRPYQLTDNTCVTGNPIFQHESHPSVPVWIEDNAIPRWKDDTSVPGWYITTLGTGTLNFNSQKGECKLPGVGAFGNTGSSERSLGTMNGLPALNPAFGVKCQNQTGGTITTIKVSYSGEQWYRHQNTPITDRLDFQYSTDATALNNGTWIDFAALDFISPQTTLTGAVNGDVSPFRSELNNIVISGLNIQPGQTFWLRWKDFDQTALAEQDMLSIDDVSISVTFTGTISAPVSVIPPVQHCPATAELYRVQPAPGSPPVIYHWSIPGGCAGWSLSTPNGTANTEMVITAGIGDCSGITVTATDQCVSSNPLSFDVNLSNCPNPAGIVALNQTLCSGTLPDALQLIGHTGTVLNWEMYTDCSSFSGGTTIGHTSTIYSPPLLTTTTCFRVRVQTPNGILYSRPATITVVEPLPPLTSLWMYPRWICPGACVNLKLMDYTQGHIQWQQQANCTGAYTNISGANYPYLYQCGILQKTCFRALVSNPNCTDIYSPKDSVTVNPSMGTAPGFITSSNGLICTGGCTKLTLNSYSGNIQWQQQINCTGAFTNLPNAKLPTHEVCNINQRTCFRAMVTSIGCKPDTIYAFPVSVNVSSFITRPTITITPSVNVVCTGTCVDLTASGGTSYNWYPGNLTGTSVKVCPPITTTYTVTGLQNTFGCTNTATITITVNDCTPVGGEVISSQTICNDDLPAVLSLQNHTGNVIRWERSTDNFATFSTIAHTQASYQPDLLHESTCFRAVVGLNSHPEVVSTPACITLIAPVVQPGRVLPAVTSLCVGQTGNSILLTGQTGSVIRWEKAITVNNITTMMTIAHTSPVFSGVGKITAITCFRAVVSAGACNIGKSEAACFLPANPPLAGVLSADQTICAGNNATVTLSGNTADVLRWETSTDNFALNITTVAQTTTSLTVNNVTAPLYLRAVVSNGVCAAVVSNVVYIHTVPISQGGTLMRSAIVCADNNAGTLQLTQYVGNVLYWEVSIDNFATFSTIAHPTDQFPYSNLPRTTWFRAVVGGIGGGCGYSRSSIVKLTTVQTAEGGILTAKPMNGTCASNSGILQLSHYSGTIIRWERSTDHFTTFSIVANTTANLSYNVLVPTQFRVVLQNMPCPVVYSQMITVNPGMGLEVTPLRECNNRGKIVATAFGGTTPYTYYILPNGGVQAPAGIFSNLSPGSYTVSARDANNCSVSRTLTIPSQVTGPVITAISMNGLNNVRVDWMDVAPGGNTVYYQLRYRKTNGTWTIRNVGSNTTYMIMNVDTVGNRNYEVQVRVRCLPSLTYSSWSKNKTFAVREAKNLDLTLDEGERTLIKLYPNPANDQVNVEYQVPMEECATLEINAASGAKITAYSLSGKSGIKEFNTTDWAEGIYLFRFNCNGQIHTQKLIISR